MAKQANTLNSIAALIQGFRSGMGDARQGRLAEQKASSETQNQAVMQDYYRALAQKARQGDLMSPAGSTQLSSMLGTSAPKTPYSVPEGQVLSSAFQAQKGIAAQIKQANYMKKIESLQKKDKDETNKKFQQYYEKTQKLYYDTYAKTLSLMNDPERVEELTKEQGKLSQLEGEIQRLKGMASKYGVDFLSEDFQSEEFVPPTMGPPDNFVPEAVSPEVELGAPTSNFSPGNIFRKALGG